MKTNVFVFFTLLLLFAQSRASEFLIQGADVSDTDYFVFLKMNSKFKPLSDYFLETAGPPEEPKQLSTLFLKAEKAFLSTPVEVAHSKYKDVIKLAHQHDWSNGERKMLFHSYLRLAQTSPSPDKKFFYLRLSRQIDFKTAPDENVFPPPLVQDWKSIPLDEVSEIIELNESFKNFKYILINGRSIELQRHALRVPKNDFRATFVSNKFLKESHVLKAQQLQSAKAKLSLASSGSCNNHQIKVEPGSSPSKPVFTILFKDNCLASYALQSNQPKMAITASDNYLTYKFEERSEPIYKKPLFWAVVGGAVAYFAYKNSKDKNDESQTTHKTGF